MELKQIVHKLQTRNLAQIARDTGVSHIAIHNIKTGKTTKPQYETVRKIVKWLEEN